MDINFDSQIHCSWFKHQDLWHTYIEKRANLGRILKMSHTLLSL